MYNLYEGNSGRFRRIEDHAEPVPHPLPLSQPNMSFGNTLRLPPFMNRLMNIIPHNFSELETEDIMLLLILYLMYKESGDEELLMIMGGMFLL